MTTLVEGKHPGDFLVWEAFRDYAGLSGDEAGEVASWALATLAEAVRRNAPPEAP